MASSVSDPQYLPVSGCWVRISDDKKNQFVMQESLTEPGVYRVYIGSQYLQWVNLSRLILLHQTAQV